MQNFIGTEWENMTEDEIFLLNQRLVVATIKRQFPNRSAFCVAHMIEYDDLVQMGNIGLLNAIRTYKNNGESQFNSYAINHIGWEIITQSKSESLRNKNTQTFELVDMISADKEQNTEGDNESSTTVLDTIQAKEETSEIGEENILQHQVIEFLKNDKDINDELFEIIVSRINGEPMEVMAKKLGIHRNSLGERLQTKKALRVKKRLKHFIQNGEI